MALLSQEEEKFFESSMALPVTRHAQIPLQSGFEFLAVGIDSLDLGLYIEWEHSWNEIRRFFQRNKDRAQESGEVLDKTSEGRSFLHLPNGKPPQYRFHLKFPEYHLYIGITNPPGSSPNAYVSFTADTLWKNGVRESINQLNIDIHSFTGKLADMKPSRCDLAADYFIPGDFNLPFLMDHKVSRANAICHYGKNEKLETFYSGKLGAPILLRIYDKGKEVEQGGKKLWMKDIWKKENLDCIWRVEFQIRRDILKQFDIETIEDLYEKIPGLWKYLTTEWFSLRANDNKRANRRTVIDWWQHVQYAANYFGLIQEVDRNILKEPASTDWYVSHISGCLVSFAAREGATNFDDAMTALDKKITAYWFAKNFNEELQKKMIKMNYNPESQEGENE